MSLLPRFYDGFEGEIKIDGVLLSEFDIKNLRSHIALVSQNITLFNDTIANNINYGSEEGILSRLKMQLKRQMLTNSLKNFLTVMTLSQETMEYFYLVVKDRE